MLKKNFFVKILSAALIFLLLGSSLVFSVGEGELSDKEKKLEEIRAELARYEALLNETKVKQVTLRSEIVYHDNFIKKRELEIEETQADIDVLAEQIVVLAEKIGELDITLDHLSLLLIKRIVKTYKDYQEKRSTPITVFFSSSGFTQFLVRLRYLQKIQSQDRRIIFKMETSRADYDSQKTLKQEKQDKLEQLKEKLVGQKLALAKQKKDKEYLLTITQNDEKQYQEMIATLRADEEAIRREISDILSRITAGIVSGSPIDKGQIIGQQGNTGNCWPRPSSSCPICGSHLHFMVLTCDQWSCVVNPESYLDGGDYHKPMDFPGSWRDYITQWYGETDFARSGAAGYKFHNGIDFAVDHGAAIRAIKEGQIYYGVDSAGGKYAIIKHGDDLYSAYWHLQ